MKPSEYKAGMTLQKRDTTYDHRLYHVLGKDKLRLHVHFADTPTVKDFTKMVRADLSMIDVQRDYRVTTKKGVYIQ